MADNVTNCAQICERMFEAVTDSLSGGMRTGFDAHLHSCTACRDEFRRVQTLLQAIDHTLSASLAAEPSAQLVAKVRENIRQTINLQPHRAEAWKHRSAWATAAGLCAAIAILLLIARTSRKSNLPHNSTTVQTSASSALKLISPPTRKTSIDAANLSSHRRKSALAPVRRAFLSTHHEKAAEPEIPEVIVQPGQMHAIFQLIAETQRGQIEGANLLNSKRKAAEPLEIKPLVIVPLKISALEDELEPSTPNYGFDSGKGPLSSRSN